MNSKEIVNQVLINKNGIAKASDFVSSGVDRQEITKLYNAGYIDRVCHGYYKLNECLNISEEQLIATTIPKAIICLESALFYYGYSDFTPRKWSIAVPRSISRKIFKASILPIQVYYVQENLYELGKTTSNFNGVFLSIYDRERTICDCFRHRSKLDNETFNKALNAYVNDDKKNLNNLSIYAKNLRVYKRVNELMEVLLNG